MGGALSTTGSGSSSAASPRPPAIMVAAAAPPNARGRCGTAAPAALYAPPPSGVPPRLTVPAPGGGGTSPAANDRYSSGTVTHSPGSRPMSTSTAPLAAPSTAATRSAPVIHRRRAAAAAPPAGTAPPSGQASGRRVRTASHCAPSVISVSSAMALTAPAPAPGASTRTTNVSSTSYGLRNVCSTSAARPHDVYTWYSVVTASRSATRAASRLAPSRYSANNARLSDVSSSATTGTPPAPGTVRASCRRAALPSSRMPPSPPSSSVMGSAEVSTRAKECQGSVRE